MLFKDEAAILGGSIFSRQICLVLFLQFYNSVSQPGIISVHSWEYGDTRYNQEYTDICCVITRST